MPDTSVIGVRVIMLVMVMVVVTVIVQLIAQLMEGRSGGSTKCGATG